MNERIFELAKQADLIQWDTLPSGARTPDHESVVKAKKFAELIVREAAQFVSGSAEVYTQAEQDACARAAIGLKKYFGVEE